MTVETNLSFLRFSSAVQESFIIPIRVLRNGFPDLPLCLAKDISP